MRAACSRPHQPCKQLVKVRRLDSQELIYLPIMLTVSVSTPGQFLGIITKAEASN